MTQAQFESPSETVAVIGLGLMGRGIVTCLLGRGFRVIGCDSSPSVQDTVHESIEQGLAQLAVHGELSSAVGTMWRDCFMLTDQLASDLNPAFVVESIVEDIDAKMAALQTIEMVVSSTTPIATNTSSIPIGLLQASCRRPERIVGMHWAEPAYATRFLEIVPGALTSPEVINATVAFGHACGKDPSVLAKDIPGFIVNRLGYSLIREAFYLLEAGIADAETIDRSFRNSIGLWATVCGPFQWMDLTGGPELYAKCMESVWPTLSNATELPKSIKRLATDHSQGIANGRGFFDYTVVQAAQADAKFHAHAWDVRKIQDTCDPIG